MTRPGDHQRVRIFPLLILLVVAIIDGGCTTQSSSISNYRIHQIVVADNPTAEVEIAAKELAGFLGLATGPDYQIVNESSARDKWQILLGRSAALDQLGLDIDWDALGPEGFVIRTVGDKLVIAGGPRRGTINGVYTFLEDVVGCRWFTPEVSVIPSKPALELPELDITYKPPFEARYVNTRSTGDPGWAARQRLNLFTTHVAKYRLAAPGEEDIDKQWDAYVAGPRLTGVWHYAGNQVHTLAHGNLLPVSEYEKHPEYFALWEGERRKRGNPCFTNPELFDFIMERVRERVENNPHARITGISHGDGARVCQCDTCKAAYASNPSGSTGTLMGFVNKIAVELEKTHPDVLVDTLGYGWTQIPPTGITMHTNVVVRYCPMWSCSYHPINEHWDDVHETGCWRNVRHRTYGKLVEWLAISPRVWVWYYAMNRANLYPFANLKSFSPTFKAMRDAGVSGVYI